MELASLPAAFTVTTARLAFRERSDAVHVVEMEQQDHHGDGQIDRGLEHQADVLEIPDHQVFLRFPQQARIVPEEPQLQQVGLKPFSSDA